MPDQTYQKTRGGDLYNTTSVREVEMDLSNNSARTTHGFIGKPITTHPLAKDPSGNNRFPRPKVQLHSECDDDVRRKHLEEGWLYIENDDRYILFNTRHKILFNFILSFHTAWPK